MPQLETIANATPALIGRRPAQRPDAPDVEKAVRRYCARLRCNASDTVAAINTALQAPGSTLTAISAGNRRAAQLHHRASQRMPPTSA